MKSITVSRQLGSLGTDVARAIAEHFGYRLVNRELINQAARLAGTPEVALATIDELGLFGIRPKAREREAYCRAVAEVVEDLIADEPLVILGRAGQAVLKDHPDVFHVRVVAHVGVRAKRLGEKQGIPLEAATAQILASDESRRKYLRQYYRLDWDNPENYDLVLNTNRLGYVEAAIIVCQALSHCSPSNPSTP